MWDERDPWPDDEEPTPSNIRKAIVVIIVAAVLITTLVACCKAVGELLKLIGLDIPFYM